MTTQLSTINSGSFAVPLSVREACARVAEVGGLEPEPLPYALANRTSIRPGVPLHLASFAWTSRDVRRLRLTEITGAPGTSIINIGLFPQPESVLPLMQAELVVIKERLSLLIIDALSPEPSLWTLPVESPRACLERIAGHAELPPTAERSAWANAVISKDAIWSRPNTAEAIVPACVAIQEFLNWCGYVIVSGQDQRASHSSVNERQKFLQHFRDIFLENEPSRPYLCSLFGSEWAERYMSEFLFVDV